MLVHDRAADLSGPQLRKSRFGEACPLNPRVTGSFDTCSASEAVVEVKRHHESTVDSSRRDSESIRDRIFLCHLE